MLNYDKQADWSNGFGEHQSPISIRTDSVKCLKAPLDYHVLNDYRLHQEIDDGTTVRLTGEGTADIFGRQFNFVQVHFHAPSEHVINGKHSPLEIHLVHQNAIGQLVVVALLVSLGEKQNPQLQQIIDHFNQAKTTTIDLNIRDWAPWYPVGAHYLGSLTTPPLTEGVEWLVISNPEFTVTKAQVDWFQTHFGEDNRATQPVNGRTVELYK
ncbi:carbonic anhydrase family protein [Lentilactobacillus parakefiri]|uniref:carbonic anhydrase n=1 Tax=Lentilactobacillus parakefiri TaxID=152332 RepID=A0A224V4E7_9LACO|nr:carbonic anhydrase family protein [Lentilactobacillus parakefiri]KRL61115.1 carbonic anhydrase [Lentilactobacillus parakefiri DSM 10551]TDG91196.1 hypothetical protein C5L28_002398 [Lentilactobacillus parakefiri]GAW71828.1 carbonic anhydrase [Lentilactobacillus parakefiri]